MEHAKGNKFVRRFFFTGFTVVAALLRAQVAVAAPDCQPVRFLDSPDALVPAGGEYHYLVDLQNNTVDEAVDPSLHVTIPNGFTFVAVNDPHCRYTGSTPSSTSISP